MWVKPRIPPLPSTLALLLPQTPVLKRLTQKDQSALALSSHLIHRLGFYWKRNKEERLFQTLLNFTNHHLQYTRTMLKSLRW